MELFQRAKAVRLRSHHDKYLLAEEDEESVCQDRNGSSRNVRWTVEFLDDGYLRLKSYYGRYLTASNIPFLLGMTGRKVLQTIPSKLDSSLEWEPVREGFHVKLKTRYGNFLRANGGLPPWRNSVTHDVPHRSATQDWILWEVDIVEIQVESPSIPVYPAKEAFSSSPSRPVYPAKEAFSSSPSRPVYPAKEASSSSSSGTRSELSRLESSDSFPHSPPKSDGRMIHFVVADDDGYIDEASEESSFTFKGTSLEELTHMLEEETGLDSAIICQRNPLNGNLYQLRLRLPPNNVAMHIVVVKSSSKVAKSFANADTAMESSR